jgi:hypothetical protein
LAKTTNESINTRDTVAEEAGVSSRTLGNYNQIMNDPNPALHETVSSGELKIGTAHRLTHKEVTKRFKHAEKLLKFVVDNMPLQQEEDNESVRAELQTLQEHMCVLINKISEGSVPC